MAFEKSKKELELNGYCIIPNILNSEEIDTIKVLHKEWRDSIPNHDKLHKIIDPHGIYKYHEGGQQRSAWKIRTHPKVQGVFKSLWETDNLIVSFDGSCYISKDTTKADNIWTHTDQAPNSHGLKCYQGFVSLTDNKERTLVVYKGTHKIHKTYFEEKGIKSNKNWQLIDKKMVEELKPFKQVLEVPAGSLVLWDSRTFHQNQYGAPNSEERLVQYVCYLPDNHIKNTLKMKEKRLKYFNEKRTTSHWPAPINVNGKQPQTYGDKSKFINYDALKPPYLEDIQSEINKLL